MKTKTAIILLTALLFSCSVKQEIDLTLDGSGTLQLGVQLGEVFINYLYDIAEATTDVTSMEELQIFDLQIIREALNEQPGMKIETLESPKKGILNLKVSWPNMKKLAESINKGKGSSLISFSESGGIKQFDFYLDKANYGKIKQMFPFLDNPVFENLAPREDERITEDEYLEIIEFAMDEEGPAAVVKSEIKISANIKGKILSQEGGKIEGNKILIKIPLLDILILNEPIRFSVKYK